MLIVGLIFLSIIATLAGGFVLYDKMKEWAYVRKNMAEPQSTASAPSPIANVAHPEEFGKQLRQRYLRLCNPPLVGSYLNQVVSVFVRMYELNPPKTAVSFSQCVDGCAKAMTDFTQRLNPLLLERPTEPSLFKVPLQLSTLIFHPQPDEENGGFEGNAGLAFSILKRSFKESTSRDYFDWTNIYPTWFTTPRYTYSLDLTGEALKRSEKLEEQWQKGDDAAREEAFANMSLLETHTVGTPLFPQADGLRPYGSILLPFDINPKRWFEGTWIVAPQGRGKTNLLRYLILHHLPEACVIIMDAKGDLINSFQRYAPIKDRLVLLYPDAEHPLAINPLDIGGRSGEFLDYIFAVLNTEMTTNQSTLLSLVLLLCTHIPNANLETFRDILQNGWKTYEQYVRKLKKRDQDFFDKEWETPLYKGRRPEVLARLRSLMATPALDEMLQSTETKVDLGQMMDEGKVVLINNNYELLGDKGAEFFGRIFTALIWAAARKRTTRTDKGRPVFFFIDEAHLTIANDTKVSTIVQQCRSQKIAMIFAHQEIQQIKNEDVRGALNNCAIKFAKPNAPDETAFLAKALRTTPEFLDEQTQSSFALYVLDDTKSAISVEVPYVANPDATLIGHTRMTDAEFQKVVANSRYRYCFNPGQHPHDQETEEPLDQEPPKQSRSGAPTDDEYDDRYDILQQITLHPAKARTGTVLTVKAPKWPRVQDTRSSRYPQRLSFRCHRSK